MKPVKLPLGFYRRADVVTIARELLGKVLVCGERGRLSSGIIVETEAYGGMSDRACHAFGGRKTPRTEVMYEAGGVSYVYLCYGLHHLFNIITNEAGIPDAVLIRAVQPLQGLSSMMRRRKMDRERPALTSGPGSMSQAMGIGKKDNGLDLTGARIWIEDRGIDVDSIACGPRIGVGYAGEDAKLPWRFWMEGNTWVSKVPGAGGRTKKKA